MKKRKSGLTFATTYYSWWSNLKITPLLPTSKGGIAVMSSQILKDRAKALEFAKIGDSHLKLGEIEQAEQNFTQAFQIAQTFPNGTHKILSPKSFSVREQVLEAFRRSYAKVKNYGSAVRVARGIEDESFKAYALETIASQVAAVGQPELALSIAQTIEIDYYQALALIYICRSYWNSGQRSKAAELLIEIITIAEKINNNSEPAWMVAHIAYYILEEIGEIALAFEISQLIENDADKAWLLTRIARRYAEVRQFEEAMQIAETIINNEEKNSAMGSIAYEYAKAGQSDEAIKIAASIDNYHKNSALIQVVGNYVAAEQFEPAKQITEMIIYSEDEDDRGEAFNAIAYGYSKIGQFEQAIQFAQSLDDDYKKDDALWTIAYRYAEIGEFEQALQMIEPLTSQDGMLEVIAEQMILQEIEDDRIFQIISVLKDEYDRKTMLSSIVYHYAHAENKADQLIKFAQSVNDESIKYKALEYLAKNFIDAKEYDKVAEIGRNIGIDKVNVTSWRFIIHP